MSVAKSSMLFAVGTLLSRVIGLLRESTKAAMFGAGLLNDSFVVAYRIPNLLREMLAEGALGASFTKVYTELCETDPQRAQRVLIDGLWIASISVGLISFVGILVAPWIVNLLIDANATEHSQQLIHQSTGLSRVLFPFITLMSIASIVSGALHQRGKFFLSSISSVALNVGFILGSLYFSTLLERYGSAWIDHAIADRKIVGLAIGVLLGGLLQLAVLTSGIWKDLLKGKIGLPSRKSWSSDIRSITKLMGPMTIAASAAQINIMVNTKFATGLQAGAVTWLSSAFILVHLPVAIFGVAIASASLPALNRAVVRANKIVDISVSKSLQESIELIIWLLAASFTFIYFNSRDFVRLVFEHNKFDSFAANSTSDTLRVYAFGLLGFSLVKLFASFFYAIGRTSYAMKVSLFSILINFTVNYFLVEKYGHLGLAATAATVVSINALLLFIGILQEKPKFNLPDFYKTAGTVAIAISASLIAQEFTMELLTNFFASLPFSPFQLALIKIVVNGCLIVGIFIIFVSLRLRTPPHRLLSSLNNLRRT